MMEGNQVHFHERTGGIALNGNSAIDSGNDESSTGNGGSSNASASASGSENQCQKNGKIHKVGEEWTEKSFKYECESGRANIKACIANDGSEIKLGTTDTTKPGLRRRCYQIGNTVQYREEPVSGVSGATNGTNHKFISF